MSFWNIAKHSLLGAFALANAEPMEMPEINPLAQDYTSGAPVLNQSTVSYTIKR